MSDLRDTIHTPAQTVDDKLFLSYHDNSDLAQRRVAAKQVRLTPESRAYMQTEIDRRARITAAFEAEKQREKDQLNADSKPQTGAVQADVEGVSVPPATGVPGPGGDAAQGG